LYIKISVSRGLYILTQIVIVVKRKFNIVCCAHVIKIDITNMSNTSVFM